MAKSKKAAGTSRHKELKAMLEERRRALTSQVRGQMRDVRSDSGVARDSSDQEDGPEVDTQGDVGLTLIQMKAETLKKIDAALQRLAEGTYGNCFECGDEIAEARLRALPFAARCVECESSRETTERGALLARRRSPGSLYTNAID